MFSCCFGGEKGILHGVKKSDDRGPGKSARKKVDSKAAKVAKATKTAPGGQDDDEIVTETNADLSRPTDEVDLLTDDEAESDPFDSASLKNYGFGPVYHEGWLKKRGKHKHKKVGSGWKNRYCVLTTGGTFRYFVQGPTPDGTPPDQLKGELNMLGATVNVIHDKRTNVPDRAIVTCASRKLDVKGKNPTEIKGWIRAIETIASTGSASGAPATGGHVPNGVRRMDTATSFASFDSSLCSDDDDESASTLTDASSFTEAISLKNPSTARHGSSFVSSSRATPGPAPPGPQLTQYSVHKEGWMKKRGQGKSFGSGWKMRYFILDEGEIAYFAEAPAEPGGPGKGLKGTVSLKGATIECGYKKKRSKPKDVELRFTICGVDRSLSVECASEEDFDSWRLAVETMIDEANRMK